MRVAALVSDLITFSRILEAATRAGADLHRFDAPDELPPAESVDLLLVDWGNRAPDWAERISTWRDAAGATRVILFGPHTDLEAHAAAREAGFGPMWARSRLVNDLPGLLRGRTAHVSSLEERS